MGKYRSWPSGRKKNHLRQHGAEVPHSIAAARPPQECWSVRECTNFKIAQGRFGQDWQKVAQFIGTKTTDQISVYAEEYLRKSKAHDVKNTPSPQVYRLVGRKSSGRKQQEQSISSTGPSVGDKDEPPPMFIKSSSSSPKISRSRELDKRFQ